MLGLGLGVEVRILRGFFDVFTQYVVRIETLIWGFCPRGFCQEGIMSGGDSVLDSCIHWL